LGIRIEADLWFGLQGISKTMCKTQGVQLGNDVTVHPISVSYVGTWSLATSETGFSLTAMQNVPGGEHGNEADFNQVRTGASPTYRLLRYAANYSRALPNNWQMRLGVSGQYTRDSLVPGEQFGVGGASSVRVSPSAKLRMIRVIKPRQNLYT